MSEVTTWGLVNPDDYEGPDEPARITGRQRRQYRRNVRYLRRHLPRLEFDDLLVEWIEAGSVAQHRVNEIADRVRRARAEDPDGWFGKMFQ